MAKYVYDPRLVLAAVKEAGGVVAAAGRCGVRHNMVSFWTRGVVVPSAANLGKLASGLGKQPTDFYRVKAA